MKDIDFLPAEMLRQRARRTQGQRHAFAAVSLLCVLCVLYAQQAMRQRHMARQLDALAPLYQVARQQQQQLKQLKSAAARHQELAALYTFLGHPWPRTRILTQLLESVTPRVQLAEIRIAPQSEARQTRSPAATTHLTSSTASSLSPVRQDLEQLRTAAAAQPTTLEILGTTADAASLHAMLARLGQSRLFASARLVSLTSKDDDSGELRFTVRVELARPLGLPAAPLPPLPRVAGRPGASAS